MKSKLVWIIGNVVIILLGVLLWGSFYFSSLLIDRETQDLPSGQDRMRDIFEEMDSTDAYHTYGYHEKEDGRPLIGAVD